MTVRNSLCFPMTFVDGSQQRACFGPQYDSSSSLGDFATWVSAFAAWAGVGLALATAIFAWRAWKQAQRANKLTIKQIKKSDQALRVQIEAALDLSKRESELEHLHLYVQALLNLSVDASQIDASQIEGLRSSDRAKRNIAIQSVANPFIRAKQQVTVSWASWSLHVLKRDPELRSMVQRWNDYAIAVASNTFDAALNFYSIPDTPENEDERQNLHAILKIWQEDLSSITGRIVGNLQSVWADDKDAETSRESLEVHPQK